MDEPTQELNAPPRPAVGGSAKSPPPLPGDAGARFTDWKSHLNSLRQHAQSAIGRLSDYMHRLKPAAEEPPLPDGVAHHLTETLESISRRQDSFETYLHESLPEENTVPQRPAAEEFASHTPEWAIRLQHALHDRLDGFESQLKRLAAGAHSEERPRVEEPPPPAVVEDDDTAYLTMDSIPSPAGAAAPWMSMMIGPSLHGDPRLAKPVRWLEENILSGNSDALYFVGQLLVFRFASPDRKPTLLKELGEAFYRCFPKPRDAGDLFEEALSAWLRQHCEAVGLKNTIELVHPGERVDTSRHAPVEKGGVEVVAVLGWVVLRDDGRVYSKASVQTR